MAKPRNEFEHDVVRLLFDVASASLQRGCFGPIDTVPAQPEIAPEIRRNR